MVLLRGVIARRLTLGFAAMALLVVATTVAVIYVARYVNVSFADALNRTNLSALGTHIRAESVTIVSLARRYVDTTNDLRTQAALRDEIEMRRVRLNAAIEKAVDMTTAQDLTERTLLAHIQELVVNLNHQVNRVLRAFDSERARGPLTTHELQVLDNEYEAPLIQHISDFQNYEAERVQATQANMARLMQIAFGAVVVIALVAVVAAALMMWHNLRTVVMPLGRLQAGVEQLSHGRFQPVLISGRDEMGALAAAFNTMAYQLEQRIQAEQAARRELQQLNTELEERVQQRTAQVARHAEQLTLINRVGRDIISLLDLNVLLPRTAQLIRETFGYYSVIIVLIDTHDQTLCLKAASTVEAVDLVEGGLGLAPGEGLVGHVALTGEPLVVGDVSAEPRYHFDARLPRVRSEMVLPLRIGAQVVGILDLGSVELNAFAPQDVQALQTLADQIAIAIQNARLYQAEAEARRAADTLRQEAQIARAEAEEANRLKSQFLANMSHELRTPLNSIINFAYLLTLGTEGELTPGQADLLNRIGDAGRHLLGLINDILDLAKIEAGRLELYFEEVDLNELITGVVSTAAGLLRDKPIELRRETPPHLTARADRTRIRQVLLNLLSNAAKFTEQGSITVRAQPGDEWITISVQDTGIGIAAEDIPKVFAEFVQLDGALTRKTGGTGLGLSICKRFVEMHGGQIWVESQPGHGSTFYFTLPRAPAPQPIAPLPAEAYVLVVDDDPAVRDMVARQLAHTYQVITLNDSRRAVELAKENQPDVVVLDVLMPYQDGWEVLNALKADPLTKDIPVVVCSMLREQQLALSLGAAGYLVKPVEREELRCTLEKFAPPGSKVLVVDDDPDALEIVSRMLDGLTYRVTTAADGCAGLATIREQMPDVVVLDLMMPGMSGFEVLAELRADPRTASLPVVVVTAKDLTAEERAQLQSKAALLLQKGQFTPDEFAATIRRAIMRGAVQRGAHG